MKEVQQKNQAKQDQSKNLKSQKRRNAMRAIYLALIALAAVCVLISGCSDNKIMSPEPNDNFNTAISDVSQNDQLVKVQSNPTDPVPVREYLTLLVTAHRVDIEGGCWVIREKSGKAFEPVFEMKSVVLQEGMRLKVYGWIDPSMDTICMLAPVFRIQYYTILEWEKSGDAAGDGKGSQDDGTAKPTDLPYNQAADHGVKQARTINLRGYYNTTDQGCMYIEFQKQVVAELQFANQICPNIVPGTLIRVYGDFSLLTWSPCNMGPLFNVYKYEVIKGLDADKEEDPGDDKTSPETHPQPDPLKHSLTSKTIINGNDF